MEHIHIPTLGALSALHTLTGNINAAGVFLTLMGVCIIADYIIKFRNSSLLARRLS